MAGFVFNQYRDGIVQGNLEALLPTAGSYPKLLLEDASSSYTPNDADNTLANVVSRGFAECGAGTGTAYARATVTSLAVVREDASARVRITADDSVFPGLNGLTVRAALFVLDPGGGPTSIVVIAYWNGAGFPLVTDGRDLTIQWDALGLLVLA